MATASWFRDYANPTYRWKYRACITVDIGSATGAQDITVAIPPDWDHFWTTVRSAGEDVRVTAADGVTITAYDLAAGFSTTTRSGTIEVDNYTVPGTGARVFALWVYWGHASCLSGLTPFAPAAPVFGYIELSRPGIRSVVAFPERPGDTITRQRLAKGAGETVHVWMNLSPMLGYRRESFSDGTDYEAVSTITYDVQLAGSSTAAMVTQTATRIIEHDAEIWARIEVKAGVDDTDYTIVVTVGTTLSQVLVPRAMIQIRNVSEA